jgi:parvulin-like peptidyl-prolyl isomerase
VILAVFVVGAVVVAAASAGLGPPDVPSGDIAVVEDAPNGDITQDEFDRTLEQTAKRQGLPKVPATDDPQYTTLRDSAISDLLLSRWISGEAEERGLTVSDTEVADQLAQIKKQQFGGEKQFQKFLESQGFSQQDAVDRVRLQLLSDQIQKEVLPANPTASTDEIQNYYDANVAQFQQPETRDVRLILNKDQAQVEKAKAALGTDPTADDWKKVAAKYSTDQATKGSGGLRQAVAQGQSEPTLDAQIFDAPTGQLVGPFKSESGYYLIEVEKVTPAQTTPLSDVSDQIKQQLVAAKQQQIASNFETDFVDKWTSRTFCADGYTVDRCENFEAPAVPTQGGAIVASTRPVAPGQATVFGTAAGLPQGPIQPPPKAGGTPIPLGTPGAPLPPGAAPPTAPPPGTAPPGTAPPGTAPPGG